MHDQIPCLDLTRQHQQLRAEMLKAFEQVYDSASFSAGIFIEEFERAFALYCGTQYSAGVSSGTAALHLGMMALGVGKGDEVIVPANTFIATVNSISYTGATPVFVDCDPHTWQIDVKKIEEKITARTKAIAGVHLYGQPFDVDAVLALGAKNNIHLLEDAAHAHGARYKAKRVGGLGAVGCFSFYPSKNLGACGEGGGVVTNDLSLHNKIVSLRNHGGPIKYTHNEIGYNYRMGALEAASVRVKLNHLDRWNERRRTIAARYLLEIANPAITLQRQPPWAASAFHLFVVTTPNKEALVKHLAQHNIIADFHYPVPCHLQKAYAHLGHRPGDFPNAEYLAAHCVSIPMFPELTDVEVTKVIEVMNAYTE